MIFVCANQKGGVGKTTTVINLGAGIAELGQRVLLVDLDPQANLTSGLGVDKSNDGIYEALFSAQAPHSVVQKLDIDNLFLIPSSMDLAGAQVELLHQENKETWLRKVLIQIQDDFDYIVIDAPPSLDILTVNALVAAKSLIIPLQCEYYSLEGLSDLMESYKRIRRTLNPGLEIFGILFTMFDRRLRVSYDVISDVLKHFEAVAFNTIIPRNVKLAEAPSHGLPVIMYDKSSVGAESYRSLAKEVIERRGIKENS